MNILGKGPRKWTDLPKALIKELIAWPLLPNGNPTNKRHPVSKGYFDQNALGMMYLAGGDLFAAADVANDITISPCVCRDDSDTVTMRLSSALTKRTDASWNIGDNSGGFDSGTKPVSDTIHQFLIYNPLTENTDALWSASATNPVLPAGYIYKRRIGSRRTDGTGAILDMVQDGDECRYKTPPPLDVNVSNQGTTSVTRTLSVPTGISVPAIMNVIFANSSAAQAALYIRDLALDDLPPSTSGSPLATFITENNSASADYSGGLATVRTNTLGQVGTRATRTGLSLLICTLGWIDKRGRV